MVKNVGAMLRWAYTVPLATVETKALHDEGMLRAEYIKACEAGTTNMDFTTYKHRAKYIRG